MSVSAYQRNMYRFLSSGFFYESFHPVYDLIMFILIKNEGGICLPGQKCFLSQGGLLSYAAGKRDHAKESEIHATVVTLPPVHRDQLRAKEFRKRDDNPIRQPAAQ